VIELYLAELYLAELNVKQRQAEILAERHGRRPRVAPGRSRPEIQTWVRHSLWAIRCQIRTWARYIFPEAGATGVAPQVQGSIGPCPET
jgi:hypothetical protein